MKDIKRTESDPCVISGEGSRGRLKRPIPDASNGLNQITPSRARVI